MTKNDILSILSILPKTGNSEFDEHIAKACEVLSHSKSPTHIQSQSETDILANCSEPLHVLRPVASTVHLCEQSNSLYIRLKLSKTYKLTSK